MIVTRSKVELYLHFVWATHRRLPLITPDIEAAVYACILAEAKRCRLEVLALNGMPDHVHLVVQKPATITEADIMRRVKGVSSTFVRDNIVAPGGTFRWQDGYGVFSFHGAQRARVIAYVQNQKRHHATGDVRPAWEEDEEVRDIPAPRGEAGL